MIEQMKTVLYIDDNPDDLFMFHKAWQAVSVSFRLKLVDGADVAREYFGGVGWYADRQVNPFPDFVLLDINMPDEDGFDLLESLRHDPATREMVVAILTGSKINSDVVRGQTGGAAYYLHKPTNARGYREIARAIEDCLNPEMCDCKRLLEMSIQPAGASQRDS